MTKRKVVKMDVRIQKETASATSATKDLQNVSTEVAINYSILETGEVFKP